MSSKIIEKYKEKPIDLFKLWFDEAEKTEINDPGAMCLSTVDKDGRPNSRMVLLKAYDDRGFKFHTNSESTKGDELSHTPYAALCFYWKSLRKQVRVRGKVERATEEEADAYFKDRPYGRKIGAWASQQSRPLDSREALEKKIADLEKQYPDADTVPRPEYWKGYRIIPDEIEFWFDNPDRLHDRFVFKKDENGAWLAPQRLYP